MNTIFRNAILFLIPAMVSVAFGGCDPATAPATAPVALTFSASNQAHATGTAPIAALVLPTVDAGGHAIVLTDFQLSIQEIKFKREEVDAGAGLEAEDVELMGPFFLDLLDGDLTVDQVIGDVQVTPGVYDGIRFVMHKDLAFPPQSNASIFLAGTVDRGLGAGPETFTIWHDTGENFDLVGTNGITIEEGVPNDLIVDFKLDSIFSGVDLTNADLTEAISPQANNQTNKDQSEIIKENIKTAADFGEDSDGDGDLEEDEDVD